MPYQLVKVTHVKNTQKIVECVRLQKDLVDANVRRNKESID